MLSTLPAWMTTDRTIVLTNAPDAYDYGYVDQLGTATVLGRDFRVVSIPTTHCQYQCDRYASGLYIASAVRL